MAMPARELDFGVDVAKASVQIDGEGLSLELSNTTRDLRTWLKRERVSQKSNCYVLLLHMRWLI